MGILAFIVIPVLLFAAFFVPRRLFKYYMYTMAFINMLLLFWALNLEKTNDGSHIYGMFLALSFIAINALSIGIRYAIVRKSKPKANQ